MIAVHNWQVPVKSTIIKDHHPLKSSSPFIMRFLFVAIFLVAANVTLLVECQSSKIVADYIKDTGDHYEEVYDYGTCMRIHKIFDTRLDGIRLQALALCQYFQDRYCKTPARPPQPALPGDRKIDMDESFVKCSTLVK